MKVETSNPIQIHAWNITTLLLLCKIRKDHLYLISITPAVVEYNCKNRDPVIVTLTNISTNTITIWPRAVLCELQPVTITEEVLQQNEEEELERKREEIVDGLDIDEDNILTSDQREELHQLLRKHKDIFATSDMGI